MKSILNFPISKVLYNFGLMLLVFTICRLAFFLSNYNYFSDLNIGEILNIFAGGLKFDISALLYFNALYIIFALLPIKCRESKTYNKFLKWLYFLPNSIALFLNCADITYYPFSLRRTTCMIFREFGNENNLPKIFATAMTEYWYITLFFVGIIIVLIYLYKPIDKANKPIGQLKYLTSHTIILCISVYFCIIGIRGGFGVTVRPISIGNATQYCKKPSQAVLVLNTPFTMIHSLTKQPYPEVKYFGEEEVKEIFDPVKLGVRSEELGVKDTLLTHYNNVCVIILESFASEYTGGLGYTPFLDSLMAEGLSFKFSFANGKQSIDAMPSVLSSIPMMIEPFTTTAYASNDINSLATYLKPYGYRSAFFHGAPNGSIGIQAFINNAGFDQYYGLDEYPNKNDFDGTWAIWDEEYLQYMTTCLDTIPQPFVSAVFTSTSHHPFLYPERYKGKFKTGPHPMYECIGYTDYALKRFFETASKTDWYKNTLFVITADHTTVITKPDYLNSRGIYEIPIFFYHPSDSTLQGVSDATMQQIDILPSVLSYLGYKGDYFAFGKDIFNTTKKNDFAVNYCPDGYQIYQDSLLLQFDSHKTIAVYDIKNDRMLSENRIGEFAEQDSMEIKLKAVIQQYMNRMRANKICIENETN
ncbi:MAG: sulfatase-like hydrolase/transferase [Paludibacteraceae bacterium]|nr:sulfatase-like hydrolase/transferase [Paludibacteraceae bacterium]